MRLDPGGAEYLHFPVTGVPFDAGRLEVCFDPPTVSALNRTWHLTQWNPDKTVASIMVGGPDAPGSGYVILPLGRHPISARLVDTPEAIVRNTHSSIEVRNL